MTRVTHAPAPMLVMLKKNWPGTFSRSVRGPQKEILERLTFAPGEVVELNEVQAKAVAGDMGHCLVQVEAVAPGKVQTMPGPGQEAVRLAAALPPAVEARMVAQKAKPASAPSGSSSPASAAAGSTSDGKKLSNKERKALEKAAREKAAADAAAAAAEPEQPADPSASADGPEDPAAAPADDETPAALQ